MDARSPDKFAAQSAPSLSAPPKTPWALLILLMAMTALGPVSLNILVPALPQLATLLASDIDTVQLTLSLFLLSLATAQLLLGPLSDRFGRRPVILGGLILAVLASSAGIVTASVSTLIVARILQAFGAATGIVVGRAIIRDLFDRDRSAAMIGLVTTVMVVAPMFAPTIGGILDTTFGWQSIFVFLACMNLIVFLWAYGTLPETRPVRADPISLWGEWRALLGERHFHGYIWCAAFGTAQFFTFIGGGPHIVVSMMGRSSAEYGLWFMVTSLGYMSGNFFASRFSLRLGIHKMIMAGLAVEFVGAMTALVTTAAVPNHGPAALFLPQVLISIGNGLLLPNAIAGAVSIRPKAAGAASGITGFTQMAVGAAAAQLVTMALAGAATPMPMQLMILSVVVIAAVSYFALAKRN